ncbi:hypothetical protein BHU72_10270 [Desulfuribacillus stibiiarsenatis]|uniref:Uncharacterized protein n=1 Tax=Desulfuribacillus stibiiarsenatis TaxID=1390249 RepID=A0A1E5L924_9FIRM|nr:hypothetical protein [Desulfuribacillus stibiiarsenatis]OEH86631.1 hypothetical protein BHU72_10270 [Desulfuribacillus stibiiarsenatis]
MTNSEESQRHLSQEDYGTRGAPWGWQESLQAKTEEVKVNFDEFIECLKLNMSDEEMANLFHVPEKTIFHLRNHFEKYGIDSMVGWD